MDKKITRRVVLGTTIAALAAGPFVVRAIKNKYSGPVLSSERDKEWRKYHEMINVPIAEMSQPDKEFNITQRFDEGKWNFVTLTSSRYLDDNDSTYTPIVFLVKEGSASYDTSSNIFSVNFDKDLLRSLIKTRDEEPETYHFLAENNTLFPVTLKEGTWTKSEVKNSGYVKELFTVDCPLPPPVKVGSKWTSSDYSQLPYEVTGIFEVAGLQTLLWKAERKYNNEQLQEYTKGYNDWCKQQGLSFDPDQVSAVKKHGMCMAIAQKSYISVEYGLVFRQETRYEYTALNNEDFEPEVTESVTQMFVG